MQYRVVYKSENSGGCWWLEDGDWSKLETAGWEVCWENGRYLGALARTAALRVEANSEDEAVEKAKWNFSRVTLMDPDDLGCLCCGPPHYFYVSDEELRPSGSKWFVEGEDHTKEEPAKMMEE